MPGSRVWLYCPNLVTTPRSCGAMRCIDVKTSQSSTTPTTAQKTMERSGRPGIPPLPPNRARLLRRNSSREVICRGGPLVPRLRLGGSPHGPPGGVSPPSGSPPAGPQGPFVSLKRPRALRPSPGKLIIDPTIGSAWSEKQWQANFQRLSRTNDDRTDRHIDRARSFSGG